MIKALVVDWGGVLMRTVDIRPRKSWEERLDLPPSRLADLFFDSEEWDLALTGQASLDDIWLAIGHHLQLSVDQIASIQHDFWAGDRLDVEMVALIRHLRSRGVRTALLSNHSTGLPHLLAELDVDDLFQVTVVSGLEGTRKPDAEIYRRVLDRLAIDPAEAVFVDDWGRNVAAARRLGMTSIRFRGAVHLQRALAEIGLPVEPPSIHPIPTIRAVVFDWGGVVGPLTFLKHTPKWEERLGLSPGTLDHVLWGPEWKQLEIGVISQEAFDDHVARGLGLPDRQAVGQFYEEYYQDDYVDQPVVAAVRALRGRYKIAMLTNAFPGHAEMAQERFGFDPRTEFDLYVNSAEVGLAKPDPAIYQLLLDRLAVAPEEAVLVDDMVRNTDAARMLGMHVVTFVDAETGLADLASLLGLPHLPPPR